MSARRIRIDGGRLGEIRDERWMDQKELAKAVGVSPHTISRIETGKTPYPHKKTVRAIAQVLGVHPNDLVDRT